ncbi:hypothetical protein HMPREF1864_00128 [Peptoniphilus sp. DNF00840]|nr:hypothetical protein HMPREF1864_00128 [Peptoniphilus sp. DNF00840]
MSTHLRKIDEAEPLWTASFFINFTLLGRTLRPQYFMIRRYTMDNRTRKNQLKIYLTDEEKEIFEKKVKLANCKTMSHFLRKCVLEKEIYIVDLEPFRNLQWLLSNATNNINQIAKATNTTSIIYKKDIDYMREKIEKLSKEIWQIHSLLLNKSKESSGD